MVSTGTLLDSGMVYFDARLSEHYPTLEVRIADVCLYADDAALIAALCRALVETEARRWRQARLPRQRTEMLRLAAWRASRSGLDDVLLIPAPAAGTAATVADALIEHVEDALDEAGDMAAVSELLPRYGSRERATFQRSVYAVTEACPHDRQRRDRDPSRRCRRRRPGSRTSLIMNSQGMFYIVALARRRGGGPPAFTAAAESGQARPAAARCRGDLGALGRARRPGRGRPVAGQAGEGHADAVAILAELGGPRPQPGSRWGVWAANPPGPNVTASRRRRLASARHQAVLLGRPDLHGRPGHGGR